MNYERGDIVILPFPFVIAAGIKRKARPALVISDHSIQRRFSDLILAGITSQKIDNILATEYLIKEGTEIFKQSGLAKTSVVRCEYVMTVPEEIVTRKLGELTTETMNDIDKALKLSMGLK